MSAAPRIPPEMGYAGLRMSAEEYLALGETPERYELVHGIVLMMSPSPSRRHSEIVVEIAHQLRAFAGTARTVRVIVETDVRLSTDTVYRPGLCAYASRRLAGRPDPLDLPPDLVVEVLSPHGKAYDLITKKNDYERFGVGEYWVIDPDTGEVRCWRREHGAATDRWVQVPVEGNTLPSAALPGFVLDLRPVRELVDGL